MRTKIDTLAAALRILARDIESGDGVANAAILEAAERLEQLSADLRKVLPFLTGEAESSRPGRAARAAYVRLVAEVAP